jgi:hypothetical protein
MPDSIKVSLGGVDYVVPKLNIGQLREITRLFAAAKDDISYEIVAVALRRAEPKVNDINEIVAKIDDVGKAVQDVLVFSGFKKETADPNSPSPAPAG